MKDYWLKQTDKLVKEYKTDIKGFSQACLTTEEVGKFCNILEAKLNYQEKNCTEAELIRTIQLNIQE
jgi:hypothetical protein